MGWYPSEKTPSQHPESTASLIGTIPRDRSAVCAFWAGGVYLGERARAEVKRWEQAWGVARCKEEGCRRRW